VWSLWQEVQTTAASQKTFYQPHATHSRIFSELKCKCLYTFCNTKVLERIQISSKKLRFPPASTYIRKLSFGIILRNHYQYVWTVLKILMQFLCPSFGLLQLWLDMEEECPLYWFGSVDIWYLCDMYYWLRLVMPRQAYSNVHVLSSDSFHGSACINSKFCFTFYVFPGHCQYVVILFVSSQVRVSTVNMLWYFLCLPRSVLVLSICCDTLCVFPSPCQYCQYVVILCVSSQVLVSTVNMLWYFVCLPKSMSVLSICCDTLCVFPSPCQYCQLLSICCDTLCVFPSPCQYCEYVVILCVSSQVHVSTVNMLWYFVCLPKSLSVLSICCDRPTLCVFPSPCQYCQYVVILRVSSQVHVSTVNSDTFCVFPSLCQYCH
jgi:hypothetical protein